MAHVVVVGDLPENCGFEGGHYEVWHDGVRYGGFMTGSYADMVARHLNGECMSGPPRDCEELRIIMDDMLKSCYMGETRNA